MPPCLHCHKPLESTTPLPRQEPYTPPSRRGDFDPNAALPQSMRYNTLPPKMPQFRFQCWHCLTWLRWRENGEMRVVKMPPICQACNVEMVERINGRTGKTFYGCARYPQCKNTSETPRIERVPDYDLVIAADQSGESGGKIVLNEVYDRAWENEMQKEFYRRKPYYDT